MIPDVEKMYLISMIFRASLITPVLMLRSNDESVPKLGDLFT